MKKFCPHCGKDADKLINALCKDCFLEKQVLGELPKEIAFEKCKHCSKIKSKTRWVEESSEVLQEIVLQNFKNRLFGPDFKTKLDLFEKPEGFKAALKVEGKVQGIKINNSFESLLKQKTVLCDPCMKISSNYFEATIQARYSKKLSQQEIDGLIKESDEFMAKLKKTDSLAQIAKIVTLKNGADFVVGSRTAAKKLAEHLAKKTGQKVIVSTTLAGIDRNGHNWSRFTYCVRL
ncbi:MAG: 60S ribosomal export protein NMD3 [Candidatus Diapherotrites archaeon]|nr:60S ribosomal export protein NMD3 [Candidatus Diapherotrites archaeon]